MVVWQQTPSLLKHIFESMDGGIHIPELAKRTGSVLKSVQTRCIAIVLIAIAKSRKCFLKHSYGFTRSIKLKQVPGCVQSQRDAFR
ncbi:hypothetical protein ASE68_03210 [Agromyces sp. Leaf222]|nr:hypothetical protein ASE68_03210 [Agromyces sp. Leaf222]